jgi:hypothetical protein
LLLVATASGKTSDQALAPANGGRKLSWEQQALGLIAPNQGISSRAIQGCLLLPVIFFTDGPDQ